jgi:aminomethyltransferase
MRTPLYDRHVRCGARMVDFAGWDMPIQYGRGQIEEHKTVRTAAGLFDVCHMGEVWFRGPDAVDVVNRMITNDLAAAPDGRAVYTTICNDKGTILDDAICYRLAKDEVLVIVNASNRAKDVAWFIERATGTTRPDDVSDETALLALQGPKAPAILERLLPGTGAMKPMHIGRFGGVLVASSGYTGESGFEIAVPWNDAGDWFDRLMEAGAPHGLEPIGLAARDTLRLEMKYTLYGNDIDETTNPLEAGLGWATKLDKTDFIGLTALREIKKAGLTRKLVGLRVDGRGIARHGYPLWVGDHEVGHVTSGTLSPSTGLAIAMGYVDTAHAAVGSPIEVEVRGKRIAATVVKTPFYERSA